MEPVTHFLTGACIGRAGLNRKTAYATLAAVLAAEAADLDVLWGLRGPVEELKHHRGITHTFIAVPVVAGAAVGLIWLLDRWLARRRARKADALDQKRKATTGPQSLTDVAAPAKAIQPVNWLWLYATAVVAALSHLLLDWTNNYGVRPFFPFNPRWYAGSFVFIAEPVLWALLLLAVLVPALLGLADSEIGAKKKKFRGRGWAIFALAAMVVLWCWRWEEHSAALALLDKTQVTAAPVKRVALEPYPINPFRWHAILETQDFYQFARIDTRTGEIDSDSQRDVLFKPASTPATEAAKSTPLGQVYLDWGAWAVVRDLGPVAAPGMAPPQLAVGRHWTTVQFSDLRFGYSFLGSGTDEPSSAAASPLSGWVYIVDGHDDAGEAMHGREQK
jgi:inner membrane protein